MQIHSDDKRTNQEKAAENRGRIDNTHTGATVLGKAVQYSEKLNEKDQIDNITKTVVNDLKKIDRCKLPGRYKAWIVQHMMMPRLMWPLSIYNVPLTTVEWLQIKNHSKVEEMA